MRLGRTPRELLASVDSAELSELFAYFVLQQQMEEEARTPTISGDDTDSALSNIFGESK